MRWPLEKWANHCYTQCRASNIPATIGGRTNYRQKVLLCGATIAALSETVNYWWRGKRALVKVVPSDFVRTWRRKFFFYSLPKIKAVEFVSTSFLCPLVVVVVLDIYTFLRSLCHTWRKVHVLNKVQRIIPYFLYKIHFLQRLSYLHYNLSI